VLAAVALSVNVSATNQIRSPSPAAVAKPRVMISRFLSSHVRDLSPEVTLAPATLAVSPKYQPLAGRAARRGLKQFESMDYVYNPID
jgi:hypothetical protein